MKITCVGLDPRQQTWKLGDAAPRIVNFPTMYRYNLLRLTTLTSDELSSSLVKHEKKLNERVGDEQTLKVTYDNRIDGRGDDRARDGFEEEVEEEVDIHSTKLQLSVTSFIS